MSEELKTIKELADELGIYKTKLVMKKRNKIYLSEIGKKYPEKIQ